MVRRKRARPGLVPIAPRSSARFVAVSLSRARDQLRKARDEARPHRGVALGALGMVADDEALVRADAHLLHAQAARELRVAARACEGGLGLG